MPHMLLKTFKLALWGLLPLFLGSQQVRLDLGADPIPPPGTYCLKARGDLRTQLQGEVSFESVLEEQAYGRKYAVLKLHLTNAGTETPHSFGFLISREATSSPFTVGTYKIARNIHGFLDYFDGVFGFANISSLGEQPLFTSQGWVTIEQIDAEALAGTLTISMLNEHGKSLDISGDFRATRKK